MDGLASKAGETGYLGTEVGRCNVSRMLTTVREVGGDSFLGKGGGDN